MQIFTDTVPASDDVAPFAIICMPQIKSWRRELSSF